MFPNVSLPGLCRRIKGRGLRHLGARERDNQFVIATRQADLLKVIIRGIKIDSAFLD